LKALTPQQPYPVIDIFAGPGGLGEGFAALESAGARSQRAYRIALSIEKDAAAQNTLRLRHFFRQFERNAVPDDYYDFLANRIGLDELYRSHPNEAAHAG